MNFNELSAVTELCAVNPYIECPEARAEYLAEREKSGVVVLTPPSNVLQIDLDHEGAYPKFARLMSKLPDLFPAAYGWEYTVTPSKTSGHYHAHVKVTGIDLTTPMVRAFFQLLLGSDPMRELLSLGRAVAGEANPWVAFETQEAYAALKEVYHD